MTQERKAELLWNISRVEEVPGLTGGYRRTLYHIGENFVIEISSRPVDRKTKRDPVNLWFKNKWIPHRIKQCLFVTTYFTDKDGMCYGWYNPTHKLSEDGKRSVIDFSFEYEDTKENREAILAEAISMWEFDIRVKK